MTDPDASPVRERAAPEPKIATVRAHARRLVRRLACRVMCRPNRCLASTGTTLGAPPPLKIRGSEAKKQNPGAKTRRGNEIGCLKSE